VHVARRDDPALAEDFKSDEEVGLRPTAREKCIPELCQGRSMYGSLDAARQVWDGLHKLADQRSQVVRVGYYIAEVVLPPDAAIEIEDLGEEDEHLTVWGDAAELAALVTDIYPAETEGA
jgi:hypothetical protein